MRPHINDLRSGSGSAPPPKRRRMPKHVSARNGYRPMKTKAGQEKRKLKMKKDIYCFT